MKNVQNPLFGTALAVLLATLPAAGAELQGDASLGKQVYQELCASCHGEKGDGRGTGFKDKTPYPQVFANPNYMKRLTPQYMFDVVKYGKLAVLKGEKQTGKYNVLIVPSFEDSLEDDEIRALISYEKFLRNGKWAPPKGGEFSREEVKEMFDGACAECHGPTGRGNGPSAVGKQDPDKPFVSMAQPAPADMTDPVLMARFSDEFIFWLIKKGWIAVMEEKKFDTMEPFGHVLSDDEIRGVVRYIWEAFIEKREQVVEVKR
ncbi:MAG: c-type cytochrome [Nitrospinota bacterium]